MPTTNARTRAMKAACPVIRQFCWPRTGLPVHGTILERTKGIAAEKEKTPSSARGQGQKGKETFGRGLMAPSGRRDLKQVGTHFVMNEIQLC